MMHSRAQTLDRAWSAHQPRDDWLATADAGALAPVPLSVAAEFRTGQALRSLGQSMEGPSLERVWAGIVERLDSRPAGPGPVRSPLRLRTRMAMASAATVATLAVAVALSAHATPRSPLYSLRRRIESAVLAVVPNKGGLHLRLANARLDDLVFVLRQGPVDDAPALARSLIGERAAALAGHVDVTGFDRTVAREVTPLLPGVRGTLAVRLQTILAPILGSGGSAESEGPQEESATGGRTAGETETRSGREESERPVVGTGTVKRRGSDEGDGAPSTRTGTRRASGEGDGAPSGGTGKRKGSGGGD